MGAEAMFKNTDLQPCPKGLDRSAALFMAKKAEEAERYEEMIAYMKRIVELCESGDEMKSPPNTDEPKKEEDNRGVEERNLISVGYKNIMSQRRTAHRTIAMMLDPQNSKQCVTEDPEKKNLEEFRDKIAEEVFKLIAEVETDIVNVFVDGPKAATNDEVIVFFKKMEGDYNRYGAEISTGEKKEGFQKAALAAYEKAQEVAEANSGGEDALKTTNPIRLGLALNFSVFYYEICDQKQKACDLAKVAFDNAIDHLDELREEAYKDSTLIMQLLKDNLTLWTESGDGDDDIAVEELGD